MKIFKTMKDLQQLQKSNSTHREIKRGLKREGHIEGYFVLIEEGDGEFELPELSGDIATLSFDGVFKAHGHYHAVYLTNNSFGIEFIIPDASWVSPQLQESLNNNAQ